MIARSDEACFVGIDLRWVVQQAAWTAIRCDAAFKKTWLRIAKTAGKKAAAVDRKILVLMPRSHETGACLRNPERLNGPTRAPRGHNQLQNPER